MSQGKLNMVKKKTTRLNTDILGISEQMDKFNSVDITIYYCGQESVTRNSEQKNAKRAWVQSQK